MKKTFLLLSILFTASLANAAGGPIPGVNVSLEQIPGGTIPTESACLRTGGKIIHKRGKTFCASKRMSGSGVADQNGDFSLKHGGRTGHGAPLKKMSGTGNTDQNGDFSLKHGGRTGHGAPLKKMSGSGNTDQNGDFTLKQGGRTGHGAPLKKMSGSGNADQTGDFTLKHGGRTGHGAPLKKMSGSGNTDNNGDFTLKQGGRTGHGAPLKKMSGSGVADNNGDFTLKQGGRSNHGASLKTMHDGGVTDNTGDFSLMSGSGNADNTGDFTLMSGSGNADQNGDFTLMSGSGVADQNGDFTLKTGGGNSDNNPACTFYSQRDCIKSGGSVWSKNGETYCVSIIKNRKKNTHTNRRKNTLDQRNPHTNYSSNKGNKTHSAVKFKAGSELATKTIAHQSTGAAQRHESVITEDLLIDIRSSASHFTTGRRAAFKIVVKNKGAKLAKGMLSVVDHMPAGLTVKIGDFRANSWRCKGGMVSSNGQDVSCIYHRTLAKNRRATLNLNVTVASSNRFPADVNEVENCATASILGAQNMGRLTCDKVKIRHAKNSGSFNLPIGIGIGLGGFGGSAGGANRGVAR